jgi:hypothetical protein
MSTISPRKLAPGMTLSRPVLNKNGLIVIKENTELTESLIGKIRDMGVDEVHIQGHSTSLPPREEALAALERRFKGVEGAPHMGLLKKLITEHIESLYGEHGPQNAQE